MNQFEASPGGFAPAPGLARRMAAFVYEGILLFAVAMATGLVYSPLVQQRHALQHRAGLMAALLCSFAAYFVYFWSRSGQTLPMKTWHIRVLRLDGQPLSARHALLRYGLSFAWWVLPVATAMQMLQHGLSFGSIALVACLALLAYAALSTVLPGRQFLHDVIAKTQLVSLPSKAK